MGMVQRIRRVRGARVLVTMLVVGVACLVAGAVCFDRVRPPYIAGEMLLDLHAVMVPTKDRCVDWKTPYWVCPEAFVYGAQHDLSVGIERQVSHVDVVLGVPVCTHIKTIAWVSHRQSSQFSLNDVDARTRTLALDLLWNRAQAEATPWNNPAPKGERSLFDAQDSTQTEWIPLGVSAVTLLPLGSLLVIPPAVVLPVIMLRRLSGVRQRCGQAVAVDGLD